MIRTLLLLLAMGVPCLPLAAQETSSGSIRVRFAALRVPRDLGKVVMVTEETRSEPFALPVNNLSPGQKAPARGFALQAEDKKGNLAKVVLPKEGRDFIILLVLAETSGFTPIVLPGKAASFKPGDVYLHNTTRKATILGQVGTTKFVLSPKKGQIIRPAGAKEGRFYDVAFGVREAKGNRLISTTRWPVDAHMRSYVFFFDDPKRKDVDFRAIDEFVPAER